MFYGAYIAGGAGIVFLLSGRVSKLGRLFCSVFEDYCRERWGWSRAHAYRQIDAAKVSKNLSPIGDIPITESQARPLTQLEPEQQVNEWEWEQLFPTSKKTANFKGNELTIF